MKKSIIFFIISVWILTGCGGGSSSNSISQNSKEYPPANLMGETSRDYIIKNAKIFIKSPNGNYKKETFTDENGRYEIKIDKFLQPLSITLVCTENSKIVKNDTEEEKCEEGMVLKSFTPPLYPGKTIKANITLLSDLAYYIADELGGLTKENTQDAIAIISQVFGGVNPIQSDPSKGKYKDVLKALRASGMDKEDKKILFAKALTDGYIDPNDPKEKEILKTLSNNLKRNYQANLLTKAVSKNRVITIITPTIKEEDPKIQSAKDMLKDMREEVISIKNYKDPNNPSVYDKELKNFHKISQNNVFPNVSYIGSFVQRMTDTIKRLEEEGLKETKEEFSRENGDENFTLVIKKETQEPLNYASWDYMILGGDQNYSGSFTYIPKNEENQTFKNAKAYSFFGSLPLSNKNSLKEKSKDAEYFKGKAVRFDNNESSYYLVLSATMETDTDNNKSVYEIKDSKYLVTTKKEVQKDVSDIKSVKAQFAVISISIPTYEINGMFKFSDYQKNRFYKKNGSIAPSSIKFSGTIKGKTTQSEFKGDLMMKIKNFVKSDLTKKNPLLYEYKIAGELNLPQHDPILLTGYFDEIEKNRYYNEISYTFGAKTIFTSGELLKDEYFKWDLTIRNQEAITMHVVGNEKGEFKGDVEVDNEKVGKFEKLNGIPIVRFKDGTFESIP